MEGGIRVSDIIKCQEILIKLAEEQGYLTFDDILDASNSFSLSVTDVDILSEAIQIRGILVYEEAPTELASIKDDNYIDYSKIDYNEVFNTVREEAEELLPLLKDIGEIVPPQYGEITLLTQQAYNGNSYARERLILSHIRIAIKIALSMSRQRGLDLADAVSAAIMGLVIGTDRFDPNGFSTFQGYISFYIQRFIQRECTPKWIDYYFPSHILEKMIPVFGRYLYLNDGLFKDEDEKIELIAETSELSFDETKKLIELAKTQMYGKISFEECPEVYLIEDEGESTVTDLIEEDLINSINKVIDTLRPKEKEVIRLRFGLDGGVEKTLEEVGNIYGVTRERIRQIEAKALRKLRHPSRSKILKEFLE